MAKIDAAKFWKDLKKRNVDGADVVIAVAQDYATGDVLMVAFQDEAALAKTLKTNIMHYYSLSRKKLWKKGEKSGNTQKVKGVRLDCDKDALLYSVEQKGGACHEGYRRCFYRTLDGEVKEEKVFEPEDVY